MYKKKKTPQFYGDLFASEYNHTSYDNWVTQQQTKKMIKLNSQANCLENKAK